MSHAASLSTSPRVPRRRTALRTAFALGAGLALAGCANLDLSNLPGPGDSGPVADDGSPLSAEVQKALAGAPATMHERIHVRAMQAGRVRLVGSVGSETAKAEAMRIADAVPGVTNVVNTLNVR